MKFNFTRKAQYNRRKLTSDVLLTLRSLKLKVTGRAVTELIEVVFVSLQTALLQRGSVLLPCLGELKIQLTEEGAEFSFEPSVELRRRLRSALTEDEG